MLTLRHTALVGVMLFATSCKFFGKEREVVQVGQAGTAMEINYVARDVESAMADLQRRMPAMLPAASSGGPAANWQNVQVLNDISVPEFNRTMVEMSQWVAGGAGNCGYCHNIGNFAADTYPDGAAIYTKAVARRMIQMTRTINSEWSDHVANTGVTCYTCHLGKPLPNGLWFYTDENQALRHYLDNTAARVVSRTVGPSPANRSSVKQTEWVWSVMMNMSSGLGVNCTFCHNSRQFASWEQSPPQRVTAYAGLQMVRQLNTEYLAPLAPVYHPSRLGPMGDAPKAQCSTCHNGVYKPLYGLPMARHYPAFWGGKTDWDTPVRTQFTAAPDPMMAPSSTAPTGSSGSGMPQ